MQALLSAIVGFFTALPTLAGLLKDALGFFREWMREKPEEVITETRKVFREVRDAKSKGEKRHAAHKLADLIRRM